MTEAVRNLGGAKIVDNCRSAARNPPPRRPPPPLNRPPRTTSRTRCSSWPATKASYITGVTLTVDGGMTLGGF